jgi:hypothetical protein
MAATHEVKTDRFDRIVEFYGRATSGPELEEKRFDARVLPSALREAVEKYEIKMQPGECVPRDLEMGRRAYEAAVEVLTKVGAYCIDTERVITISREEIEAAMAMAPSSETIGVGDQAVVAYGRRIGDERRLVVTGGLNGAPVSDRYHLPILRSVANENVDGLHTGALQDVLGYDVRTRTPIELLACKKEALAARQAIDEAGKPGLCVLGIMSGATAETQDAGDFEGGLRQTDRHLVVFLNEVKFNFDLMNKVMHDKSHGVLVEACSCPIHGGYSGGCETTAICGMAEVLLGYVMCEPENFSWYHQSLFTGSTTSREAVWIHNMMVMGFRAAGKELLLDAYVGPASGPWTPKIGFEVAAQAVTSTAVGMSGLYGACGAKMRNVDYTTGIEARMLIETSRAAAGMGLEEANEIGNRLLAEYEEELAADALPLGKTFPECYEADEVTPKEEYVALWEQQKEKMRSFGLKI